MRDAIQLTTTSADSSASNWTDPKYTVFRDHTGGAIGFVVSNKHAIAWGNPACVPDDDTYRSLCRNFVEWCYTKSYEPIFSCVSEQLQRILCNAPFGFHSLTSTVGQYVDLEAAMQGGKTAGEKRARRAQKVDTEVATFEYELSDELRQGIEEGLANWQDSRSKKGKQVHTSELKPFRDMEHRIFFVARHPSGGEPQGLLVLTEMLDGYYVKWNLAFQIGRAHV